MTVENTVVELTDLTTIKCPSPLNMELPENVREFLPSLELADEVYDWCTSPSLYVSGNQRDDGTRERLPAQIINPWSYEMFPVPLTQDQAVKVWMLRFMFLKKHRSIVLGQGGYFVGELNREYCAMVEAERFRLRWATSAADAETYRENAEKAISFARDMLESLGTELREHAESNDWCDTYDNQIESFAEILRSIARTNSVIRAYRFIDAFEEAAQREEEIEVDAYVDIKTRKTVSVIVNRKRDQNMDDLVQEAVEAELEANGEMYGYDRYDSEAEVDYYDENT